MPKSIKDFCNPVLSRNCWLCEQLCKCWINRISWKGMLLMLNQKTMIMLFPWYAITDWKRKQDKLDSVYIFACPWAMPSVGNAHWTYICSWEEKLWHIWQSTLPFHYVAGLLVLKRRSVQCRWWEKGGTDEARKLPTWSADLWQYGEKSRGCDGDVFGEDIG